MANRTVLGEFDGDYVLRVSRPGHNVLNTNLARKNLAFDSRWPEVTTIVNSGFVNIPISNINFSHPHGGTVSSRGPNVLTWLVDNQDWRHCAGYGWANAGGAQRATFVQGANIRVVTGQSLSTGSAIGLQFVTLDSQNG